MDDEENKQEITKQNFKNERNKIKKKRRKKTEGNNDV